ncbi:MAG: exodeoxyribonuclease III [Bacteroidales bacterium]|nr:exodeoxyribonuclease III [Bacteroidales bacterium]
MKILSYNVNGIRAAMSKGFVDWLKSENPDVISIQETKANIDQVNVAEIEQAGYLHYWNSAEKKGYSGVAVFCKNKPDSISFGLGIDKFDIEGRVIRADFGDLTVINSYFPSGTTGDVRQDFKMEYLEAYLNYIKNLEKTRPNLLLNGDFNICHKPIDINHPERHQNSSGFLPEEREWFDRLVNSGFVDTFRVFNSSPNQYSWWSYRQGARGKNLGWRIDYNLVSNSLKNKLKDASILSNVVHSDHCPVSVLMDL